MHRNDYDHDAIAIADPPVQGPRSRMTRVAAADGWIGRIPFIKVSAENRSSFELGCPPVS